MHSSKPRGVALVLVLAFLALISVFIIGFFSSASGELTASSSYAASITTRQLADSTTALVEGQIREATTRIAPSAIDVDRDLDAWASQPGMIRTFKGGPAASTETTAVYKLYSSSVMTIDGIGYASQFKSADDLPTGSNWLDQPATWVDINEPVSIVDPTNPAKNIDRYPVFDPAVFDRPGGSGDTTKIPGAELTQDGSLPANRQARMPVRWLYVLRDGTIVAPLPDASGDGRTVTFDPNKQHPSADNPIVGRVAFWTDDDTCKINVNTAGGFNPKEIKLATQPGSYWDTPHYNTIFDRGSISTTDGSVALANMSLALSQPASGEFQRYPGHPGTTSLGDVLQTVLNSSNAIYNLTPRYVASGRNKNGQVAGSDNGRQQTKAEKDSALFPKFDRLYSSVDELLYAFSPDQAALDPVPKAGSSASGSKASGQRLRHVDSQINNLTPEKVDQLRFFLTAHSRAPELNLFGRPRITLWPMWPVFGRAARYPHYEYNDTNATVGGVPAGGIKTQRTYSVDDFRNMMNPSDRLLAFCSMIGNGLDDKRAKPYMFQRYDPYSSMSDWSIPRNQELLKMLADLTSTPVPGYGGAFSDASRFGKDSTQVITEMFDYIRTINMRDATHDIKPNWDPSPPVDGAGGAYAKNTFKYAPRGIVIPSVITMAGDKPETTFTKTAGFGRFPIISEIAIDFYHAGYVGLDKAQYDASKRASNPGPAPKPLYLDDRIAINNYYVVAKMIACFLCIETFNPMQGYSTVDAFDTTTEVKNPRQFFIIHEITGLDAFKMHAPSFDPPGGGSRTWQSFQMPHVAANGYFRSSANTWAGRGTGGTEGFTHPFFDAWGQYTNKDVPTLLKSGATSGGLWYPFQSPQKSAFPANANVLAGDPNSQDPKDAPFTLPQQLSPVTHQLVTAQPPNGILVRDKDTTFDFQGGKLTVKVKWNGAPSGTDPLINTYEAVFPDGNGWPMPTDNIWNGGPKVAVSGQYDSGGFRQSAVTAGDQTPGGNHAGWVFAPPDLQFYFFRRVQWAVSYLGAQSRSDDPFSTSTTSREAFTKNVLPGVHFRNRWRQIMQPGDTVRSVVPAVPERPVNSGKEAGDMRVLALLGPTDPNPSQYFTPHPYYGVPSHRHAHNLRAADGTFYVSHQNNFSGITGALFPEAAAYCAPKGSISYPQIGAEHIFNTDFGDMVQLSPSYHYITTTAADLPPNVHGVLNWAGQPADFDTGTGVIPDGAYTGKGDEGTYTWKYWDSTNLKYVYTVPYYQGNVFQENSFESYFSPNRQIQSAVSFGSLLAGRKKSWQTLAFSPNPANPSHPGISKDPKDHVLLDFFTMPVVEPYAISEPFSTAGKVNLNYPIVPFNYIKRTTGLRAVLSPVRITAVGPEKAGQYKDTNTNNMSTQLRWQIDATRGTTPSAMDKSIGLFDEFFNRSGGEQIFHSASQVCEIFLFSSDPTLKVAATAKGMPAYWKTKTLTSDNMRERPYADIYPRVTTKSNTYTIYMRVQTLRKRPLVGSSASSADFNLKWDENQDQVLSEYRGSSTIERYLDPQDQRMIDPNRKDYLDPDKKSLEPVYRFRVVESKRFSP